MHKDARSSDVVWCSHISTPQIIKSCTSILTVPAFGQVRYCQIVKFWCLNLILWFVELNTMPICSSKCWGDSDSDLVRSGLKSNHVKPFPLSRTSQKRSARLQSVSQSLKDLARIRRWCHMTPKDSPLHRFMCISSQKNAGAL